MVSFLVELNSANCIPLTFQLREDDYFGRGWKSNMNRLQNIFGDFFGCVFRGKETNKVVLTRSQTNDLPILLVQLLYHSNYRKLVGAVSPWSMWQRIIIFLLPYYQD